jgi:hypothetical protein
MRPTVRYLLISLAVSVSVLASADEKEKAEKQVRMMTAMSRDDTARSIISYTFADTFKLDRLQLVAERKSMGLNYGSLFLVHQLASPGVSMQEIAAQLRLRKNVFEIANASRADWRRIASEAKKMNSRVEDNIYKHFLHPDKDKARDLLDQYNPESDLIRADADPAPEEILKAQAQYLFWRNLAAQKFTGQADPSSSVAHGYTKQRDDVAASQGKNHPGAPVQ